MLLINTIKLNFIFMNKTSYFIIGAIVIIVAVVIIVGTSRQKNDSIMQPTTEDAMMKKEPVAPAMTDTNMMKETSGDTMMKSDAMMKSGTYEAYAAEKITVASDTHDVVLFFRASWCPTCIAVDKDIKANLGKIPSSLTILDVNYDNSTALKQKYGVTYQHTFVQVDKDGNLIKKWSGSPTLTALVAEVK